MNLRWLPVQVFQYMRNKKGEIVGVANVYGPAWVDIHAEPTLKKFCWSARDSKVKKLQEMAR